MDALVMLVFVAAFVGVWLWMAKYLGRKGRHWLLRHLAGSTVGLFAGLLIVAFALEAGIIDPVANQRGTPVAEQAPEFDLTGAYTVQSDKLMAPYKRTVEVALHVRLDQAQLAKLAEIIKAMDDTEVARTFIGYRLDSLPADSSYWATTHYNPDLEVAIQGLSPAEYRALLDIDTGIGSDELLGSWIVERGFNYLAVAYKRDGQYAMADLFPDGSRGDAELLQGTMLDDGSLRLEEPENDFGEYFTIDPEGNLRFWGERGNYFTAAPRASLTEPAQASR